MIALAQVDMLAAAAIRVEIAANQATVRPDPGELSEDVVLHAGFPGDALDRWAVQPAVAHALLHSQHGLIGGSDDAQRVFLERLRRVAVLAQLGGNSLPPLPVQQPAEYGVQQSTLTAAQAQAILDDPRMILVSRTHPITEDYPVETKECGSATAINKTLQTEAADAFLSMQAAAAKEGVDVRMQSGYRSVSYQKKLYDNKTQYYRDKGLSEAAAREKAAVIVNPPGCSEHNCGLAADLNSPEHTTLDTGFADTAAFRWLCENAEQYGFILRYPKEAESVTGITYEPWHWRYVGAENAALLNQSGLCLEDAVAVLQRIAAGETVTG